MTSSSQGLPAAFLMGARPAEAGLVPGSGISKVQAPHRSLRETHGVSGRRICTWPSWANNIQVSYRLTTTDQFVKGLPKEKRTRWLHLDGSGSYRRISRPSDPTRSGLRGTVGWKRSGRRWAMESFHDRSKQEDVWRRLAWWRCTSAGHGSTPFECSGVSTDTVIHFRSLVRTRPTRKSGSWTIIRSRSPANVPDRSRAGPMDQRREHWRGTQYSRRSRQIKRRSTLWGIKLLNRSLNGLLANVCQKSEACQRLPRMCMM